MYVIIFMWVSVVLRNANSITLCQFYYAPHFGVVDHSLCGVDWMTVSKIAQLSSLVQANSKGS